jgi:hypothetical protein
MQHFKWSFNWRAISRSRHPWDWTDVNQNWMKESDSQVGVDETQTRIKSNATFFYRSFLIFFSLVFSGWRLLLRMKHLNMKMRESLLQRKYKTRQIKSREEIKNQDLSGHDMRHRRSKEPRKCCSHFFTWSLEGKTGFSLLTFLW